MKTPLRVQPVKATDEASPHALFVKLNEIIEAVNELESATHRVGLEVRELRTRIEKLNARIDQP